MNILRLTTALFFSLCLTLSAGAQGKLPDIDEDDTPDKDDSCPYDQGPAGNNGCPKITKDDDDGDDIANKDDQCPAKYGPKYLKGCPSDDVYKNLPLLTNDAEKAKLLQVINAAPGSFASLRGEALIEGGVASTSKFTATTTLPGAECYINRGFSTSYIADFGTSSSLTDAIKTLDLQLTKLKATLGSDYSYREGVPDPEYKQEKIWYACKKIPGGFQSGVVQGAVYKQSGGYNTLLMIIGGARTDYQFVPVSTASPTGFSQALLTLYDASFKGFENLKGAMHEEGVINKSIWYELKTSLPGASCSYSELSMGNKGAACWYPAASEAGATTHYTQTLDRVKAALGSGFIYYEKPPEGGNLRTTVFGKMSGGGIAYANAVRVALMKHATNGQYYVSVAIGKIF